MIRIDGKEVTLHPNAHVIISEGNERLKDLYNIYPNNCIIATELELIHIH